jgi:tetratricopeptide (TPR) repeat protein
MTTTRLEKLYASAIEAGENRNYPRAIELFMDLLSRTDEYPDALLYLGRSFHAIGEFDRAVSVFRLYLATAADSSLANFFIGRSYLALGLPDRAARHLSRSVELDADFAPALSLLGLAYLKLKRPDHAVSVLERAVTLDPNNARAARGYQNALFVQAVRLLGRGDFDMARQILEFVIRNGLPGIHPRLYLASAYRGAGMLEAALAEYTALSAAAPNDQFLRWYRVSTLIEMGNHVEASKEIEAIRAKSPDLPAIPMDSASINRYLAWAFFQQKSYRKVIDLCRECLKAGEADVHIHVLMAESLKLSGSLEKARAHYERAIALDRDKPDIRYGYLMTLWELADYSAMLRELEALKRHSGDPGLISMYTTLCMSKLGYPPEEIIPQVQEAIRKYGPNPELMFALADAYRLGGIPELSLDWYRKVLTLTPDHEPSLSGLVEAHRALEDTEGLVSAYSGYLERFPDRPAIRRDFIALLFHEERYDEAADQIDRNAPYGKPSPRTEHMLGICYRKTGRYREAAVLYKEILRRDPKDTVILRYLALCLDKLGNRKFAILLLQKAIAAIGNDPELSLILGTLLFREGSTEKSLDCFRTVCELAPKDWRGPYNIAMVYRKGGIEQLAAQFLETAEKLRGTPIKR